MARPNGRISAPNIVIQTAIPIDNIYEALCFKINVVIANVLRIDSTKYRVILGESEIEKLLHESNQKKLDEIGIELLTNSDHTYKRSVLARNIAIIELKANNQELTTTIESNNDVKITEIIRIPGTSDLIKIRFTESRHADKIIEKGLKLKWTSVQHHNLTLEAPPYIPLICKSCYKINDHRTSKCTYKGKICSLCSGVGHRYDTCHSSILKCINCSAPHCTLSRGCEKIKQLAKQHRRENYPLARETYTANYSNSVVTEGISFADRMKGRTNQQNDADFPPLPSNNHQKTATHWPAVPQRPTNATSTPNEPQKDPNVIFNYVKEFFKPNTRKFASTLNKMLAANGLATYVFLDELFEDAPPSPVKQPAPTTEDSMEVDPSNNKRPREQSITPDRPAMKAPRAHIELPMQAPIAETAETAPEAPQTELEAPQAALEAAIETPRNTVRIYCESEAPRTTHELIKQLKRRMAKPQKGHIDTVISNLNNRHIQWDQLEFVVIHPRSRSRSHSRNSHTRQE